jgi:hypothetical protein
MSFKSEGNFPVVITEALLAEPKFAQPPAFDIAIHVQTEDGQSDWWRGEISQNYGKGNVADKTQAELTLGTLEKLGWQHGYDFSKIGTLVGVQTEAGVKASQGKNGGTFYNVRYLGAGGGDKPQAIDPSSFNQRWAALTGSAPAAPAPAPAPKAPPAAPAANPFAKPAGGAAAPAANPFAKR